MEESVIETEPTWIGRVLSRTLPLESRHAAAYISYDEDARRALALVVTASALIAAEIVLEKPGSNGVTVERRAVPLSAVRAISTITSDWIGKGPVEPGSTSAARVFLAEDLPPFGTEIALPMSIKDYDGSKKKAREETRTFADKLTALLPK